MRSARRSSMRSRPTCSISTIRIWTRSFIRLPRSPHRFWRWRKRGGFPAGMSLTAFILGVEVECRIGNAVSPGHYARGWHITSTCGVFGAAAACAKLLGLSADGITNAIGIAASQSAGIVENLPTAAKNVSVGNAARNGLFAALLAAEGYDASARAIEGPLGWARAMGDEPDLERLVGGLGNSWEIAKNTYKPYPAGIVFHAVIDACFKLRARLNRRDRRYRIRHGAGFGAAAGARRPSGSQRTRCAGQHSSLRRLRAVARRGRRPGVCRTRSYFGPTSCRCARR